MSSIQYKEKSLVDVWMKVNSYYILIDSGIILEVVQDDDNDLGCIILLSSNESTIRFYDLNLSEQQIIVTKIGKNPYINKKK